MALNPPALISLVFFGYFMRQVPLVLNVLPRCGTGNSSVLGVTRSNISKALRACRRPFYFNNDLEAFKTLSMFCSQEKNLKTFRVLCRNPPGTLWKFSGDPPGSLQGPSRDPPGTLQGPPRDPPETPQGPPGTPRAPRGLPGGVVIEL